MPQLYSLGGKLVSKSEYEKAHGINQEPAVKVATQPKEVSKEKAKEVPKVAPKAKKQIKKW